jgi:hypothetical protein
MNVVEEGDLNFEPVIVRKHLLYHPKNIRYTQDSINPSFKDGNSLVLTLHFFAKRFIYSNDLIPYSLFLR